MPKAVDIYVLQKKIGSGQFGDVFKGYSKVDGTDVAIKTISRNKVKGKFTQLLQNEIQVLKSCHNNNIIQLIDIKKTVNNIYLVLEYCNEGDLGAYLKQKKKLHEDEAVEYLVQILHAFQTLVKSKIMHRDFKLPNVLKTNGVIKIADFGFAKLLGTEDQQVQTILGSPLNMAPEVLDHQSYNSKADIWSIGVAFYEMLFGKVPYTATNIVDLLSKIHKQPIQFPHKISPVVEDVIRKMLVVSPTKRIDWNDLFTHPITRFRQDKLQNDLKQSLCCENKQLSLNMSRFYIKANMVIDNTHDIMQKAQFNNYLKEVMRNETLKEYNGKVIKRQTQRTKRQTKQNIIFQTDKEINQQEQFTEAELNKKELKEKLMKENSHRILHERNVYAFLGHLAEELIFLNKNKYAECLAFLLIKRTIEKVAYVKSTLSNRSFPGIFDWQYFEATPEYTSLINFIKSEEEIFNRFYEKLSLKVLSKGTLEQFEDDLMMSGKFTKQETNRRIYDRVIREYFKRVQDSSEKVNVQVWKHISKLIDSTRIEQKFTEDFQFNKYYAYYQEEDETSLQDACRKKYKAFCKI